MEVYKPYKNKKGLGCFLRDSDISLLLTEGFFPFLKEFRITNFITLKKLENFGGNLLIEDDHSYWAPPYWNIMKETFLWVDLNSKSNCKNCKLMVLGMFIKK